MATTISIAQLAAELRITADATTDPPEPIRTILQRHLTFIGHVIEDYAPAAPGTYQDEAAVRYVGYIYDRPTSFAAQAFSDVFRNSGAMNVLSAYRSPLVVDLDDLTPAPPSDIGETIIVPSHPVHPGTHNRYIGWSADTMVTEAELAAGGAFTADVLTVPDTAVNGYLWFAVPQSIGYPRSLIVNSNPLSQLPFYQRQAGTLTGPDGTEYIIGLNPNLLNGPASVGDTLTLGF